MNFSFFGSFLKIWVIINRFSCHLQQIIALLLKQFWSIILSNEFLGGDTYLDAHSDIKLSLKAKIFVQN